MPKRSPREGSSPKRAALKQRALPSPRAAYQRALRLAQQSKTRGLPESLELLQHAAQRHYGPAQYALATWYLFGVGVRKNATRAVALLRKATARGVPSAAFDLAVSLERGVGVKRDEWAAFRLYRKAATLGDHQSEYEVGRCYHFGIGTQKSETKAMPWFARALKHGVEDAVQRAHLIKPIKGATKARKRKRSSKKLEQR